MKRYILTLLTFALCCGAIAPIVLTTSCATKQTVAPGSDVYVVNAEQAQQMAFEAVDFFLRYEQENRVTLWQIDPEIKRAADRLRATFPDANKTFMVMLKKYKDNRTPENRADLNTWLAVLETARHEAYVWMAKTR